MLISQGSYDYPWLGINITGLTPTTAQSENLETINGTVVKGISPGSPADSAGIEIDDIITAIDGNPASDVAALISYLGEQKAPGETVTLAVKRGISEIELSPILGKRQ